MMLILIFIEIEVYLKNPKSKSKFCITLLLIYKSVLLYIKISSRALIYIISVYILIL
jgi:hypothetical protein